MNAARKRILGAVVLAIASAGAGYGLSGGTTALVTPPISTQTITPPDKDSVRIIYSLDRKQTDKELIAIIDEAQTHAYFAIYTFTLDSIADALVRAKKRGVDVRGLIDTEQARSSYGKPIVAKLAAAGIPLLTQKHPDANGIMHIKALVTDSTYVIGSYNWTNSATTVNDEIVEVGTDPSVVDIYRKILLRLFERYKGTSAAQAADVVSGGLYDYAEAGRHIGEHATVRGILFNFYTSTKGTVFLDFCQNYKACPFSAVIFADDVKKFGDLSRHVGKAVLVTGTISSYQGRAEMKLSDPSQISS